MPRASTPEPPDDLDARIDKLFGLPLDGFIAARNALAAELKRERRAADAARVKGLTRPTLPAWALNQVYWHARADFDRLTATGDRMRDVQRQALAGRDVDMRGPTRDRQQAIRVVVDRAAALMRDGGQTITDATRQRIAVLADAIAAYGSRPREYTPGRMEEELDPPGFEALAGLAAATPPLRLVKPQKQPDVPKTPPARDTEREDKAQARARAAAEREAERQRREELKEARGTLDRHERELDRARRTESAATRQLKELQRNLESLKRQLAPLEQKVDGARTELEAAQRQVKESTEALETSRRQVRQIESSGT